MKLLGVVKRPKQIFLWVMLFLFIVFSVYVVRWLKIDKDDMVTYYKLNDELSTDSWKDYFALTKDLHKDDIHKYTENIIQDSITAIEDDYDNYDADFWLDIRNGQIYNIMSEIFYEQDGNLLTGTIGMRLSIPSEYKEKFQDSDFSYNNFDVMMPFYGVIKDENVDIYFKRKDTTQWYKITKPRQLIYEFKDPRELVSKHLKERTISPPWHSFFGDIVIETTEPRDESLRELTERMMNGLYSDHLSTRIDYNTKRPTKQMFKFLMIKSDDLTNSEDGSSRIIEKLLLDAKKDEELRKMFQQKENIRETIDVSNELEKHLKYDFSIAIYPEIRFVEWGKNDVVIPQEVFDNAIEVQSYDVILDDFIQKLERVPYKYQEELDKLKLVR